MHFFKPLFVNLCTVAMKIILWSMWIWTKNAQWTDKASRFCFTWTHLTTMLHTFFSQHHNSVINIKNRNQFRNHTFNFTSYLIVIRICGFLMLFYTLWSKTVAWHLMWHDNRFNEKRGLVSVLKVQESFSDFCQELYLLFSKHFICIWTSSHIIQRLPIMYAYLHFFIILQYGPLVWLSNFLL